MNQANIVEYFIDEAKEHLQTIETCLMGLESMIADQESMNEVFRAAHSIKGGAAMLGFAGIQHTSHKLEDYFKILKENPNLPVDKDLQTLFLQGFDKLQDLLIELQSPSGLSKEKEQEVLRDSDPIFDQLQSHLNSLITGGKPVPTIFKPVPTLAKAPSGESRAKVLIFQKDVTEKLRALLQGFKQPDRPTNRIELQKICDQLATLGDQFDLAQWSSLVHAARDAIGNQNNVYRDLAPIIIRELKQSQDLILADRATEVTVSPQLRSLAPYVDPFLGERSDEEDISTIFGMVEDPPELERWKEFGKRTGWFRGQQWVVAAEVNYSNEAPQGHLPAPIWLETWHKPKDRKADPFHKEYEVFLAKLKKCLS